MSTIVTATIPTDRFALERTFEAIPDATFESVSSVAHGRDMPLLWGSGSDLSELTTAIREDPTTENVEVVSSPADSHLYRIGWCSSVKVFLSIIAETDGTVLEANGTSGGWKVRFLFPTRDAAGTTHELCCDHGIEMTVHAVQGLSQERIDEPLCLTEEQREALTTALEAGYFDVPRETGLEELASQFGISHQALSERIRRGQRALLTKAFVDDSHLATAVSRSLPDRVSEMAPAGSRR